MAEHRVSVDSKFTEPGCWASCSCDWTGPVRDDHHAALADARQHFSRPEAASRVSSQPPRNDGSALDGRTVEMRGRAEEWGQHSLDGLSPAYPPAVIGQLARDVLELLARLDSLSVERASLVAGLSADVTRPFWADRERRLRAAAEVRVKELEALVSALAGALKEVGNAYGCYAGCTGSLPGAPANGHTPACRNARAALPAALPPVPVGPDGEAAGTEANSAKPAEVRGKADA